MVYSNYGPQVDLIKEPYYPAYVHNQIYEAIYKTFKVTYDKLNNMVFVYGFQIVEMGPQEGRLLEVKTNVGYEVGQKHLISMVHKVLEKKNGSALNNPMAHLEVGETYSRYATYIHNNLNKNICFIKVTDQKNSNYKNFWFHGFKTFNAAAEEKVTRPSSVIDSTQPLSEEELMNANWDEN